MKVKCFWCKILIKTPQLATWTAHLSIIWSYQPNGSAFHLCVENFWKRSFNARTDTSATTLIIAILRWNVTIEVTKDIKTLVSDVQESQEKASAFCRKKYLRYDVSMRRWFRYMFRRWCVPMFFMLGQKTHYFTKTGLWPNDRLFWCFWWTFVSESISCTSTCWRWGVKMSPRPYVLQ